MSVGLKWVAPHLALEELPAGHSFAYLRCDRRPRLQGLGHVVNEQNVRLCDDGPLKPCLYVERTADEPPQQCGTCVVYARSKKEAEA